MKVRTVQEHANRYGDKWFKEPGKTYEVADDIGEKLIANGFVEAADAKPKK